MRFSLRQTHENSRITEPHHYNEIRLEKVIMTGSLYKCLLNFPSLRNNQVLLTPSLVLVSMTIPETLLKGLKKSCHTVTLVTHQQHGSENAKGTEISVSPGRKCLTSREKGNSEGRMLKGQDAEQLGKPSADSSACEESQLKGPLMWTVCVLWGVSAFLSHHSGMLSFFVS